MYAHRYFFFNQHLKLCHCALHRSCMRGVKMKKYVVVVPTQKVFLENNYNRQISQRLEKHLATVIQ